MSIEVIKSLVTHSREELILSAGQKVVVPSVLFFNLQSASFDLTQGTITRTLLPNADYTARTYFDSDEYAELNIFHIEITFDQSITIAAGDKLTVIRNTEPADLDVYCSEAKMLSANDLNRGALYFIASISDVAPQIPSIIFGRDDQARPQPYDPDAAPSPTPMPLAFGAVGRALPEGGEVVDGDTIHLSPATATTFGGVAVGDQRLPNGLKTLESIALESFNTATSSNILVAIANSGTGEIKPTKLADINTGVGLELKALLAAVPTDASASKPYSFSVDSSTTPTIKLLPPPAAVVPPVIPPATTTVSGLLSATGAQETNTDLKVASLESKGSIKASALVSAALGIAPLDYVITQTSADGLLKRTSFQNFTPYSATKNGITTTADQESTGWKTFGTGIAIKPINGSTSDPAFLTIQNNTDHRVSSVLDSAIKGIVWHWVDAIVSTDDSPQGLLKDPATGMVDGFDLTAYNDILYAVSSPPDDASPTKPYFFGIEGSTDPMIRLIEAPAGGGGTPASPPLASETVDGLLAHTGVQRTGVDLRADIFDARLYKMDFLTTGESTGALSPWPNDYVIWYNKNTRTFVRYSFQGFPSYNDGNNGIVTIHDQAVPGWKGFNTGIAIKPISGTTADPSVLIIDNATDHRVKGEPSSTLKTLVWHWIDAITSTAAAEQGLKKDPTTGHVVGFDLSLYNTLQSLLTTVPADASTTKPYFFGVDTHTSPTVKLLPAPAGGGASGDTFANKVTFQQSFTLNGLPADVVTTPKASPNAFMGASLSVDSAGELHEGRKFFSARTNDVYSRRYKDGEYYKYIYTGDVIRFKQFRNTTDPIRNTFCRSVASYYFGDVPDQAHNVMLDDSADLPSHYRFFSIESVSGSLHTADGAFYSLIDPYLQKNNLADGTILNPGLNFFINTGTIYLSNQEAHLNGAFFYIRLTALIQDSTVSVVDPTP